MDSDNSNNTLNVGDFVAIRDILKVAIERGGAFKAEEMHIVGDVFNRLNLFVNHIQSVVQTQDTQDQQDGDTEPSKNVTE